MSPNNPNDDCACDLIPSLSRVDDYGVIGTDLGEDSEIPLAEEDMGELIDG